MLPTCHQTAITEVPGPGSAVAPAHSTEFPQGVQCCVTPVWASSAQAAANTFRMFTGQVLRTMSAHILPKLASLLLLLVSEWKLINEGKPANIFCRTCKAPWL